METSEDKLNAFELDRIELVATQQLLKIVLNHIIQEMSDPRQTRETIASLADALCDGYAIGGFGPDKTAAAREYMKHHVTSIMAQVGNPA